MKSSLLRTDNTAILRGTLIHWAGRDALGIQGLGEELMLIPN